MEVTVDYLVRRKSLDRSNRLEQCVFRMYEEHGKTAFTSEVYLELVRLLVREYLRLQRETNTDDAIRAVPGETSGLEILRMSSTGGEALVDSRSVVRLLGEGRLRELSVVYEGLLGAWLLQEAEILSFE